MQIFANRFEDFQPRNKISYSIYEEIYRSPPGPSVSLPSVESRDSGDDMRVAKIDFIKDYKRFKNITDSNISESEVELQKTKNKKT